MIFLNNEYTKYANWESYAVLFLDWRTEFQQSHEFQKNNNDKVWSAVTIL